MSKAEAIKLDILLGLQKNGYNLVDGDKPEIMTMGLGGGYTLICNVKKPSKEWTILFNDGIEASEYPAKSEKVIFTFRNDSDKLIDEYDAALRDLLENGVEATDEPEKVNSVPVEQPEGVIQEPLSNADKLAMLDKIMDGGEEPVKQPRTQTKHTVQKNSYVIPVDVRSKQIQELTDSDIIDYLCPNATKKEAMIFLKVCQARGINPFLKEAYLIKYKQGDPASMVVAKDYFAKKAEEHPMYDGYESGIIIQKENNELERREGAFMLPSENLVGGWCKVYRKDRSRPTLAEVAFHEYVQKTREGVPNIFWSKMGATMIKKVAFSQGHRDAFPGEFSGLYDSSEIEGSMEGLEESVIEANYVEVSE